MTDLRGSFINHQSNVTVALIVMNPGSFIISVGRFLTLTNGLLGPIKFT